MSDLVRLARQKIEVATQRQLQSLPGEVEAIKREHASKGLARSGATLKRARAMYIASLQAHGETIAGEYKWAIQHALLASQTWSELLASEVAGHLEPLMNASAEQLAKLAAFTGQPEVAAQLVNDVKAELMVVEESAKLAIRCAFAEKRRSLVRTLPGSLWGLVAKFFRPGT